jgi:hypothetical protein
MHAWHAELGGRPRQLLSPLRDRTFLVLQIGETGRSFLLRCTVVVSVHMQAAPGLALNNYAYMLCLDHLCVAF